MYTEPTWHWNSERKRTSSCIVWSVLCNFGQIGFKTNCYVKIHRYSRFTLALLQVEYVASGRLQMDVLCWVCYSGERGDTPVWIFFILHVLFTNLLVQHDRAFCLGYSNLLQLIYVYIIQFLRKLSPQRSSCLNIWPLNRLKNCVMWLLVLVDNFTILDDLGVKLDVLSSRWVNLIR